MKNSGHTVQSKDSADYFRLIFPPDTVGRFLVYKVHDFYLNENPKSIKTEARPLTNLSYNMAEEGICYDFYPNRQLKKVAEYDHGIEVGNVTRYYPNGKVYCIMAHTDYARGRMKFVECRDSTDKVIAKNGKGNWIKLDDDLKEEAEGPVIDSVENGDWHSNTPDSAKFECLYEKGLPKSGIGYDKTGKAFPFTEWQVEPVFKHGKLNFIQYLETEMHYPEIDRRNNIQGKVTVTFVIEKDGKVTGVKILTAPSQSLRNEALRIMALSPTWQPGLQYGMPVRVQFTVPISFSLADVHEEPLVNLFNSH